MITITKEARRNQSISNAVYDHILERQNWFEDIENRIKIDIFNNPSSKSQIVLKWLKSCEKVGSEIVKAEILKKFND